MTLPHTHTQTLTYISVNKPVKREERKGREPWRKEERSSDVRCFLKDLCTEVSLKQVLTYI